MSTGVTALQEFRITTVRICRELAVIVASLVKVWEFLQSHHHDVRWI
jgi:hypothetical protein